MVPFVLYDLQGVGEGGERERPERERLEKKEVRTLNGS